MGRVLEIARYLNEWGIPYRLQLLGNGSNRPRYEQYVMDNDLHDVIFHGWVPRDTIGQYYAESHFVLLPSQSEGWPKVLSEGMAYGVVPIAGAVSGIPRFMEETGVGVALPYTDTEGMAAAIAGYARDPERWQAASSAGLRAAHRFSYTAYQQAVADLFLIRGACDCPSRKR
ncbi:MAG: glycosyltransferase family 4 protein [Chloroflexota bacterium]